MNTQIKTFEDACKALNISPDALPIVSALPEKHQKALTAHYKLVIVAEALNAGWQPNWNDYKEYKYYPWLEVDASAECPSGVGFSDAGTDCDGTVTGVGSRLCYRTRELAKYAGEQFADLYKDYFLIG